MYGGPDPEVFEAYKYVLYNRIKDTKAFMKQRLLDKKKATEERSCISKCGSLIKTLIVYSVVAAFVIPAIYEIYTKLINDGKGNLDQDYETVTYGDKEDLTPEDIAKRA